MHFSSKFGKSTSTIDVLPYFVLDSRVVTEIINVKMLCTKRVPSNMRDTISYYFSLCWIYFTIWNIDYPWCCPIFINLNITILSMFYLVKTSPLCFHQDTWMDTSRLCISAERLSFARKRCTWIVAICELVYISNSNMRLILYFQPWDDITQYRITCKYHHCIRGCIMDEFHKNCVLSLV